MTELNFVLSEIVERVFTSCRVAVALRSGKCLALNVMKYNKNKKIKNKQNFSKFCLFLTLLLLAYMGTVIVILLNIVLLIKHKQKSLYRVNIHLCINYCVTSLWWK